MRKGTCKHFTGIRDETCEYGVNYRQLVGGPDFGWVLRLPCKKEKQSEIVCIEYDEPTAQEIEAHDRDVQETMRCVGKAIEEIMQKHPTCKPIFGPMSDRKEGASGVITCPKCGGELRYSIAPRNNHIWGQCQTDDCLSWMQ